MTTKYVPVPDLDKARAVLKALHGYLHDGRNSTPNHMLDSVIMGRDLLAAIVEGGIVLCYASPDEPPKDPE